MNKRIENLIKMIGFAMERETLSTSDIQKKLRVMYPEAASIRDDLCLLGACVGPLSHQVNSESVALLLTLTDAIAEAQMERDCAAVCSMCAAGDKLIQENGVWKHVPETFYAKCCKANKIREAFRQRQEEVEA